MKLEVISKTPAAAHMTPLLFVHGAWHGAWCWDVHFLDYFAQHGFAAHALSLRAHGASEGRERLRWTRIKDYVADVASVVETMPVPPIVIGHSMGGFIVQKYLEQHQPRGAVLLASVPPQGALRSTLRLSARHPLTFAKANLLLSLYPIVATPELAREAFFSTELGDAEVNAYWSKLQDESFVGFLDMLALDLPRPPQTKVPVFVLAGERDTMIEPCQFDATARAYGVEAIKLPNLAHDIMLDAGWQAAADQILTWLKRTLN